MTRLLCWLIVTLPLTAAQNYTAQKISDHGVEVIRLTDAAHGVEVSIVPSIGNAAYEVKVHGRNILFSPVTDAGQLKGQPGISGIPFLAPWANRMTGGGFWADGRKYLFNAGLGSVREGSPGIFIHGMLATSPLWELAGFGADGKSAHETTRLQFWKYPELMANWPFAQEYEMTYRLANGVLEVETTIVNKSAAAMPVTVGYHPCYNIPDVARDEQELHIPAKTAVLADERIVATGEMKPVDSPDPMPLRGVTLDNGYTDFVRGADGRAVFRLAGGGKQIEVQYGPKWQVAQVYVPKDRKAVTCIEPMAAITNGPNLAHEGKYSQLQMLAPGATWRESFWVGASGL